MISTVFMLQYAHKGAGFDGWYNLRAFTTLEAAEKALKDERAKDPACMYCINSKPLES